jgi:hypothetical protein
MAVKLKCPGCAASIRLADSLRGKFEHQMYCPKCGEAILISGAGDPKTITISSIGGPRKAAAQPATAPPPAPRRSRLPVVLGVLLLLAFLGGGAALAVYFTHGPGGEQQQVGGHNKNDADTDVSPKPPGADNPSDEPLAGREKAGGRQREPKRPKKDTAKEAPMPPQGRQGGREGRN